MSCADERSLLIISVMEEEKQERLKYFLFKQTLERVPKPESSEWQSSVISFSIKRSKKSTSKRGNVHKGLIIVARSTRRWVSGR